MSSIMLMDLDEVNALIKEVSIVGITGAPGAGKTTLCEMLTTDKQIIHTDSFIHEYDHEDVPDMILANLPESSYIIEGTQTTRLLSRGWEPDLLICVIGSEREDCVGIRNMIKKHLKEYPKQLYKVAPRLW